MSALHDPELRREDAQARALALSLFDRPLFLEAGAGTGKTTTLVARIVAWCVGPGWHEAETVPGATERQRPDVESEVESEVESARVAERVLGGVLAITFTEAAAAEMESKIRSALRTLESGAWPRGLAEHRALLSDLGITLDTARTRAAALSAALERRIVLTIHAWCLALLAEHPLEAGLAPQFHVDAEGTDTEEIVRETLEAALVRAFGAAPDPDWLVLARRNVGPAKLEEALRALLARGVRGADLERDPFTPERIAALVSDLGQSAAMFVEIAMPLLENVKAGSLVQTVLARIEATSDAVPAHAVRSPAELQALCDGLRLAWDKKLRDRLAEWARGIFGKKVEKALGERAPEVQGAARELRAHLERCLSLDPELATSARRVLVRLSSEVERRLRARGIATFADLLRDARDLLRDHRQVRAQVRRRTRQILVDEFQDTDPLQCDLVRSLALDETPEMNDIPRPGLFVVGDPKQSIYAWRSADLAAYEAFQREMAAAGGVFQRLSVNYRSTPAILRAVERAMVPVMIADPGVQPAFEPLVAHAKRGGAPVERWVSWEVGRLAEKRLARTSSERSSRIEARWLAAELDRQHGADVPWQEMAILLRTASPLETYLEALRERGIPYDVAGDKSYYRRREIIDAAALARCVIDPLDRLSLVTALRSSVIGVPDAALIPLWTAGFPGAMSALAGDDPEAVLPVHAAIGRALAMLPAGVPGMERIRGWEACLYDAVDKIGCLRRTFAREAWDVFVERLRTLFLSEAIEAARHLGAWRVANLERFFRRLSHALTSDVGDPYSVLRALGRALSDERDAEEARPKSPHASGVQVMTIHKSKGLDFAHVYVASMHRDSHGDSLPDVDVARIAGRTEFVLFGASSPDYGDVHARRAQHAAAERVRTLYVAMTRAEERLVLLGAWPETIERKPVRDCRTHRELLEWSAPPELPQRLIEAVDRSEGRVEIDEALYLLPPPDEERIEPAHETEAPTLDVGGMESDAARLRQLCAAAVERMARPFATGVAAPGASSPAIPGATLPATSGATRPASPSATSSETMGGLGRAFESGARAAALAGSAVHRALEDFDWQADRPGEVLRRRAGLRATIERLALTPERELEASLCSAESIFDRFVQGALFAKLGTLSDHLVARELPLISVPRADSSAVGYVSGTIDLVYRDLETGELVIADYKTDSVRTPAEAAAHATRYAAQAVLYPRMLREALGLDREPRFELWFLQADCVLRPTGAPSGPESSRVGV